MSTDRLKADRNWLSGTLRVLQREAKLKRWGDKPQDVVECCGYIFTAAIENGQFVLAVSLDPEGERLLDMPEVVNVIGEVIGKPHAVFTAQYPNRGLTKLYSWPMPKGAPP